MERSRLIACGITLLGVAAFVVAIVPMVNRVRAFNAGHPQLRLHAEPITSREFTYADFPTVKLADAEDEKGNAIIRMDFAGKTHDIRVKRPPAKGLPGLAAYDEWVKVLGVEEVSVADGSFGVLKNTERLLLVSRQTPEGYDPDAWGSVRRIEWVFELCELKRDGSVSRNTWRWPRSDRAEKRLFEQASADLRAMPKDIVTDEQKSELRAEVARAQKLIQVPTLKQRTLEYFVALHVMPKLSVPNYKFNDTAFNLEVLGWTMPMSMCAVLLIAGGLVFTFAPRRTRAQAKV